MSIHTMESAKATAMSRPPTRAIRRLLVANRGEIAARIIASARELHIETFALYTKDDSSHACEAAHALELSSSASYMNIDELVQLARQHNIDTVHPGYGFLSESENFAHRMWTEANAVVVGPGWSILSRTGDKSQARLLASECGVPVLPGLEAATDDTLVIQEFAQQVGFPIMIKAVDGGGGRGIRLVRQQGELAQAAKKAIEESPSHRVIAEKAVVDGFRHVEVQILGDGRGNIRHLWERECSIQRRYQKVIEFAPSSFKSRDTIARVIQDAMKMAQTMRYFSLGTFEFLVDRQSEGNYYFLEVNPRLQVEHTITESISLTDIVKMQLLLSQGASFAQIGLAESTLSTKLPPPLHSIQLRITAENVANNWSLSIGNITSFRLPSGNGVRVDTNLRHDEPQLVSPDFDSLLAKVIVTAGSWNDTVQKAKRALEDTAIFGIQTNLQILRAIVSHPDFANGCCDTRWLESKQKDLLNFASRTARTTPSASTQFTAQAHHLDSRESAPTSSEHRRGQPSDPSHIIVPFAGKLVEVAVGEGDVVDEDSVICVVQQMKIELEIRSPRAGRVTWAIPAKEGSLIHEGTLAAIIEPMGKQKL